MEKIKKWNFGHSISMLLAGAGALIFEEEKLMIVILLISFGVFFCGHRKLLAGFKPYGGYANWVSLFRLMLILFGGILLNHWSLVACFSFFVLALCLDGLDGYLARKFNQSSDFGAYFDMETDSFYVAFLSTYWYLTDKVGAWLLFIGFLRYLYVFALKLFKLEKKKEKSTRFAKTIAVVLMSALLAPFILPTNLYLILIILSALLTIYSFGVSFVSRVRDLEN
jgi:phosphatidylglycerophosphate synthase